MNKLAVLHPEHLLERARRDGLDPEAWSQLGAHLGSCRACAWEQAAITDFARERAVGTLDAAGLDRLVDGALGRAGLASDKAPARASVARRGRARAQAQPLRRPAVGLAAAAMVAVAIVAALALPARSARDGARPALATPTEASLDAGAGLGLGSDS